MIIQHLMMGMVLGSQTATHETGDNSGSNKSKYHLENLDIKNITFDNNVFEEKMKKIQKTLEDFIGIKSLSVRGQPLEIDLIEKENALEKFFKTNFESPVKIEEKLGDRFCEIFILSFKKINVLDYPRIKSGGDLFYLVFSTTFDRAKGLFDYFFSCIRKFTRKTKYKENYRLFYDNFCDELEDFVSAKTHITEAQISSLEKWISHICKSDQFRHIYIYNILRFFVFYCKLINILDNNDIKEKKYEELVNRYLNYMNLYLIASLPTKKNNCIATRFEEAFSISNINFFYNLEFKKILPESDFIEITQNTFSDVLEKHISKIYGNKRNSEENSNLKVEFETFLQNILDSYDPSKRLSIWQHVKNFFISVFKKKNPSSIKLTVDEYQKFKDLDSSVKEKKN